MAKVIRARVSVASRKEGASMLPNTALGGSVIERYRSNRGKARDALTTPALILDAAVVRRNIAAMAARTRGPTRLRPHAKSHKCAQIARLQVEAGAIGVTTATVWEAAALVQAGIEDVLIANQVVGEEKVRRLAEAACQARLTVAVDDSGNAEALSAAARAAGSEIGVLVEIDVGMNRCGVRSWEEAVQVAERVHSLPGLRFRGVMGYEGHCSMEADRTVRARNANAAMEYLLSVADALAGAGLPVEVVSAGGTGTYDLTGMNPRVTEIQAGSYVFMDAARLAIISEFAPALTVLATVISRQGSTLVLDSGKKTVSPDFTLPTIVGFSPDQVVARKFAEEHLLCEVAADCSLAVGDRVELVPGYCPTTVNLHEVYHVVEEGVVVDLWPVLARGAGTGGIA
jgi:D-serine deaminase-like pyridoxal phosphate-dependent protein